MIPNLISKSKLDNVWSLLWPKKRQKLVISCFWPFLATIFGLIRNSLRLQARKRMILKLSYYLSSFSWETLSLSITEDYHQPPPPKGFRKYWKKRRCISPPNSACLFPTNSGHSVKMSTPGHLMSGHQISENTSHNAFREVCCPAKARVIDGVTLHSQSMRHHRSSPLQYFWPLYGLLCCALW